MTQKSDGMKYAPRGEVKPVCGPGEFRFAAVGLDHGHIYGMCNGLIEAGGELAWVYDPDPRKMEAFCQTYPGVAQARGEAELLEDPSLALIASAPVPCQRGPLGLRRIGPRQRLLHRQAAVYDARAARRGARKSPKQAENSPSTTPNDCTSKPPSMPGSSSETVPSAACCR